LYHPADASTIAAPMTRETGCVNRIGPALATAPIPATNGYSGARNAGSYHSGSFRRILMSATHISAYTTK
jgi:hypothetical protein